MPISDSNASDDEKLRRLGIDPSQVRQDRDGDLRMIQMGGNCTILITDARRRGAALSDAQDRLARSAQIIKESIGQLKRYGEQVQQAEQNWLALEAWAKALPNWRKVLTEVIDMASAFLTNDNPVTREDVFCEFVQKPHDAMLADLKRLAPEIQEQRILLATRESIRGIQIQVGVAQKVSKYLLRNASKAGWFKSALGFDDLSSADLSRQIRFDHDHPYKFRKITWRSLDGSREYSALRLRQEIEVTGPNGATRKVICGWVLLPDGELRFVTAFPAKQKQS